MFEVLKLKAGGTTPKNSPPSTNYKSFSECFYCFMRKNREVCVCFFEFRWNLFIETSFNISFCEGFYYLKRKPPLSRSIFRTVHRLIKILNFFLPFLLKFVFNQNIDQQQNIDAWIFFHPKYSYVRYSCTIAVEHTSIAIR